MIYDCFIFFNELDLLEIRLNELDQIVDKFVIVEATQTFQGKPKKLFYEENKNRYEKFHDKIIHIVISSYPNNRDKSPWIYENHQRNSIVLGLTEAASDDTIMLSDIDEIPNPAVVKSAQGRKGIRLFSQKMCYYYLNCVKEDEYKKPGKWLGTVMLNYKDMRHSPEEYRKISMRMMSIRNLNSFKQIYYLWRMRKQLALKRTRIVCLEDAGWHFSFLGGISNIIEKIESFSHQEYNNERYKDPQTLEAKIRQGGDIFNRNEKYIFVPIDSTWPEFLIKDPKRFKHLIRDALH